MGDMSDLVSHFITKNLCKNQGCLDYGQLCQMISPICKDPDKMLVGVLTEKNRFVIVGKEETGCSVRPDSVVVAKTPLRVCQSLPGNCHRNCGNLHLCRYFVCGYCRYRNKCRNCHELDTEHNAAVLMSLGLQNLEPSELFLLLLQNDPYLLPEVCVHYNRADGLHGACQFKGECTNLHICRDLLLGACRADGCMRVHKFDPKAMKILSGRGVSPENRSFLFRIYRNRYLISSSMETPQKLSRLLSKKTRTRRDAVRNSICLFFIRSECTYDEKCNNIHFHLPYKWQVLVQEGSTWTDLPNNEDIEKAYCNPENNTSLDQLPVNFCTMMCGSAKVRRLSTVSSVTKPADFILTTNWLWYWRTDQGQWIQYQHEANGGTCSITSEKLEVAFQDDIDGDILLSKGGQRYVLSFKGMYEVSIELQTRQEVRRRPRFLSALQVKKTLERETEEASSCSTV